MTKREIKKQQTEAVIEMLQNKFGAKNFDNDQGSYFTFEICAISSASDTSLSLT